MRGVPALVLLRAPRGHALRVVPVTLDLSAQCEITGSARFSRDGALRNEIRRWWVKEPKVWAAWLMLNPSVASRDRNDPTARRVTHFSQAFGCDGWIGVNLYPFISSTPAEMWRWANWQAHGPAWDVRDDLLANLQYIEDAARLATLRMVAFGAAPIYHDEPWLEQCVEAFSQPSNMDPDPNRLDPAQLFCLGVNQVGQPLHPLARGKMRVPNNQQPIPWTRE